MKEIIKLNFGSSAENFDEEFELNGNRVHVRSIGVDYDPDLALDLVRKYSGECDAFALSGFLLDIKTSKKTYAHTLVQEIRKVAGDTPVLDGNLLRKAAYPWALKKLSNLWRSD